MNQVSEREQLIFEITKVEWEMFQQVENTGGRASCQDDPDTFFKMRMSQWMAYSDEVLHSYLQDCQDAKDAGWNLVYEKYARMMETSWPEEYALLADRLPALTEEKTAMVEEMVAIHVGWDRWMMEHYPNIRKNGRLMTAVEDSPQGGTSSESYLRGELLTYSERTLRLLLKQTREALERGENLLVQIIENETKFYGYPSLEEAEKAHAGD